jgi:hypothetical protein
MKRGALSRIIVLLILPLIQDDANRYHSNDDGKPKQGADSYASYGATG